MLKFTGLSPCYGVENKLGVLVIQCDNVLDEFINRNFDSNLLSENNDYNNYREFFHLCDTQKKIVGWSQSVEEKINYILNRIPRQASLNSTSETNTVITKTTTNITSSADNPVPPINETTKQKSDNNTKEKQNAEESDFNSTAIIKKSSHSISISNHETKKQNNTIPQDKGDPIVESFKSVSAASNYSLTASSTTPSNGTVQQNDDKHIQNIIQSSDKSELLIIFSFFIS